MSPQDGSIEPTPKPDTHELIGYDVEAVDGHAGRVVPATDRIDDDHLVVRTGRLLGREVVIETDAIREVDPDQEVVELARVKEWVKQSPKLKHYQEDRPSDGNGQHAHTGQRPVVIEPHQ